MKIVLWFLRYLLQVRYTIHIENEEVIKKYRNMLLLPNHVALVDPLIVFAILEKVQPQKTFHPVVVSTYAKNKFLRPFFKTLWAITISDVVSEDFNTDNVKTSVDGITTSLLWQDNVVLYPSGWLKTQAEEVIGGKKSAWSVVKSLFISWVLQEGNIWVVAITTHWLWWSSSSKAWIGKTPSLMSVVWRAVLSVLANLIFFMPKRQVTITFTDITTDVIKNTNTYDVIQFNRFLEKIYNKKWIERLQYVPYFFYYNDVTNRKFPEKIIGSKNEETQTYDDVVDRVDVLHDIVSKIQAIKSDGHVVATLGSHVSFDLYFDSLDTAELKTIIQSDYPWASNPPLLDLQYVGDFVRMALWKNAATVSLRPCDWTHHRMNTWVNLSQILGDDIENETILTLFKKQCLHNKRDWFCYDASFWVQTKRDYLIKAYLIADIIRKIDGQYIGIMLPAVTASSLLITATYLAWKIPVMLNWTIWEAAFDHCVWYKNIATILTSKSFFIKVKMPRYDKYNFTFLEDVLRHVSLRQKITALAKSMRFALPRQSKEAVVLFTSWSESLPKAVSLTHQNIIQNLWWSLQNLTLTYDDILLWFLPPFHSFGFTVNTILPLITGLRVVYTPDPNDSKTIANMIEHTKLTAITSTPTFIKKILSVAAEKQLQSLRFLVVWAEKCPESIFEKYREMVPHGMILEGYGITECSPVVSVNPMPLSVAHPTAKIKHGTVWMPIWWIEITIIDLQTMHKTKPWQEWMICVAGASVFSWYIDKSIESPFIQIDWKQFYKTGDLWYLDKEWYLYITWRLKRFVKTAWEMISLPFLEWILLQKYGREEEISLAVEWKETDKGTAYLVMFTLDDIKRDDVNKYLRKKWVSNLMQIDEVRKIDIIPILGTGKTDYKILKNML